MRFQLLTEHEAHTVTHMHSDKMVNMSSKDQNIKSKDGDVHAWLIVAASTFIYYLSGTITFIQGKNVIFFVLNTHGNFKATWS